MFAPRGKTATTRRGAVAVLAALLMIVAVGMVACAVDIGYVALVRTQLQRAADSAALAAVAELPVIPGSSGQTAERTRSKAGAARFAGYNNAGQTDNLSLLSRDIDFFYNSNPASYNGSKSYAAPFFNMATVTVRCDQSANEPVAHFFAPVLGVQETAAQATATAACAAGRAGCETRRPLDSICHANGSLAGPLNGRERSLRTDRRQDVGSLHLRGP